MREHSSTLAMKLITAALVVLILLVAAFGLGVGIGVGQGRAMAASSAVAAPIDGAGLGETAQEETLLESESQSAPTQQPPRETPRAQSAPTRASLTPAVPTPASTPTATLLPQPTPTRQDKSTLPDEAPLDMELFNEAWRLLKEQYYGNLPEGEDVTYAAIRGLVSSLGDKHTAFLNPEQAEAANTDMEGQFEGIGALVEQAEDGGVRIEHLFADQPAQKAGIEAGDVVIAVDGRDITEMDLNEAITLIRGPRGTKVILTIRRDEQASFDITVTRARVEIPVVETETLADGKVEYISLSVFSSIAPRRLADALEAAVAKNPQGIVLDLRDNPGGLLDASVRIGSYFVPEGNIVIERFSDGRQEEYKRQGSYLLKDIPLVVLINGGSASASEIVAGAIQDAGVGKLLGTTTYGKGSVQIPNSMSDGSQLRVTIARWYTPKDRGIDGTGLSPDIEAPDPTDEEIEAEQDPQLDRAIEYLLTGE